MFSVFNEIKRLRKGPLTREKFVDAVIIDDELDSAISEHFVLGFEATESLPHET